MNTKEHKIASQNRNDRTATGQQTGQQSELKASDQKSKRYAKSDLRFWTDRLKKRSYVDRTTGNKVQTPNWQVRLFHVGKEAWFDLETANKAAAASKARDIYADLVASGWDATLAKHKPRSSDKDKQAEASTVGVYLDAVKSLGKLRLKTFRNYENCFRSMLTQMFGLRGMERSKYDYRKGGRDIWIKKTNAIRLDRVTPELVTRWQRSFVKQAGNSPQAIASAKRTANSYIRCSRSLFTKTILKELAQTVTLPPTLPFTDIELFEAGSMRYISKINVQTLILAARNELKQDRPEQYKAFLLGLFAGLRRGEIDGLEWKMFDFSNSLIHLEQTEFLHLKTSDSAGTISIDPEVAEELREFMKGEKDRFVISSEGKPRPELDRPYYRCELVFEKLTDWLRAHGVTANKPLHELRKELGALIASEQGIFAASRVLRHSDISTTARHYADQKTRINIGLGKYLKPGLKVEDSTQQKKTA